jgi:hypothetical protein
VLPKCHGAGSGGHLESSSSDDPGVLAAVSRTEGKGRVAGVVNRGVTQEMAARRRKKKATAKKATKKKGTRKKARRKKATAKKATRRKARRKKK